jgi:hypothetical protein
VIWRVVIQTRYFFAGSSNGFAPRPTGAADGQDRDYDHPA